MNYLIGDIGNSYIKISILNHKFDIKKTYSLATNKIHSKYNRTLFFKKFLNKNLNKKILFSSVVPKVYKKISNILKKKNLIYMKLKT